MERVTPLYQEMEIALTVLHIPLSEYLKLSEEERVLNLWWYTFHNARQSYFSMPESDRFWWPGKPPRKAF